MINRYIARRSFASAVTSAVTSAVFAVLAATAAPLELRWRAEASNPQPYAATIYHGETITLAATLTAYNSPIELDPGTTCTLYYQTNGMAATWWEASGIATGATLRATWTPAQDVGAPLYTFFLAATTPGGRLYRAHGTLSMRASPGFTPAVLPPPDIYPEFAAALWLYLAPLSSAVWEPRLDLIEQRTNSWNTAYGWGNHAIAGYVTQETDPIALPLLATHTNDAAIHLTPEQAQRIANAVTNEQDLAALRTYHYGSPDIVESPEEWFFFDASTGTITGFYNDPGREHVVIPWQIDGVPVVAIDAGEHEILSGHPNLKTVYAPRSLVRVANRVLEECPNLEYASFSGAVDFESSVFLRCPSLVTLYAPRVVGFGANAFADTSVSQCNIVISVSPPSLGNSVFSGSPDITITVDNPTATGWGATFGGRPVVRLPVTADSYTLNGQTITEWPAGGADYSWTTYASASQTPTITVDGQRSIKATLAGDPTITIEGLDSPAPVYITIQGADSITIAGAYYVGGGSYQAGMVNHYVVWQAGGQLMVQPITATEED